MPNPGFGSSQEEDESRKIRASIDQYGSRGSIAGLVKHLQSLVTISTLLHTDLLTVEDAREAITEADEHLKSRADEAPSEVNGGNAGRVTEEEIRAAKQLIEQTRTQAEQARKRAEELQIQQQQAEEALQDLQQVDANPDNFSSVSNRGGSFTKLAADWKRKQAQQNTAPDDWIGG
ncbi:hypothetical protein DAPPUDRAFT_336826, partial [Daphnia pulex]